jgi:hypothetical protein
MKPCILVANYQYFCRHYCFHLQEDGTALLNLRDSSRYAAQKKFSYMHARPFGLLFYPEDCSSFPQKLNLNSTELYGVTCQKRVPLIVTASQETHYISTEPNRLMLCGETIAVCCENSTEHTDTVRTSQETHHISTTEPNRLMLCGETVAV